MMRQEGESAERKIENNVSPLFFDDTKHFVITTKEQAAR